MSTTRINTAKHRNHRNQNVGTFGRGPGFSLPETDDRPEMTDAQRHHLSIKVGDSIPDLRIVFTF